MENFYNTSLKNMTLVIFSLLMGLMSYTNLNAQLVGVASSNASSFCDSSCDTLDLTVDVYIDGQLWDPPGAVGYSWTGPNGFSSNIRSPRVPMTTTDQSGTYCVVLTTFPANISIPSCVHIDVEPTIEWTCPEIVTVTGADCSTDLVDYSFTINAINCPPDPVNWDFTIYVNAGVFYNNTGSGGSGDIILPGMGTLINGVPAVVVADLPFGTHEMITTLTDPSDPSKILAQCISELRVVESINNVACNDNINVTLNEDCEAILTPDMILEGTYCYANFTLEIDGYLPGNTIMLDAPGDYVVTVTGVSGISCWGTIAAEDKSTPLIDCEDFDVYCSDAELIAPGTIIRGFGRDIIENTPVVANSTHPLVLNLLAPSGTVIDIELNFHAEIEEVDDLELILTAPDGLTSVQLLDLHDGNFFNFCTESNINICLRDDAILSHANFGSTELCRSTLNAFIGEFRPQNPFSGFNNTDAWGNWTLEVVNNSLTDDMLVVKVDFRVITNEGIIPTQTDIILNTGCSEPDVEGPTDEYVGVDCENGYWNTIERTWVVTNNSSGLSATCTHNINLLRWTVQDIIWPKSYDNLELPVIHCFDLFDPFTGNLDESLVTEDTIPAPSVTGYPRIPFGEMCGNFQMTKTDLKFNLCGKYASKTIRTWSVLDWCTGELVHYDQIIKVVDDQPIEISCQPDHVFDIYTDSYTCTGDWEIVPPLNFSNSCDADITWQVFYLIDDDENPNDPPLVGDYIDTNVEYSNGIPSVIRDLPSGRRTWIKYVASDDCGNTGECFTEVDVFDDDLPNPVCIEFTVVALSNDGCAKLHAESIDNGSWDNCGIESFHIKKSYDFQWMSYVEYCCNCVLNDEKVHLRVTDINGNTNTCEVDVKIQDNIPPTITNRPQNFFNFDCADGPVDVGEIILNSIPQFAYEDNCDPNDDGTFSIQTEWSRTDGGGLNDPLEPGSCGLASVNVNWIIRDECGNTIGSHNQNISIGNSATTFNVNWPFDPQPFTNCSTTDALHPDNLSSQHTVDFSDVNTFACNSSIAITWDDLVFENVEGSCLKILRTWTVIDWCIADVYGLGQGTQSWTQVLRVHDIEGPNIDVPSLVTVDATTDACTVFVGDTLLIANITDQCTDMFTNQELTSYYEINYADGSFSSGTGEDARGDYPYGTSTITWYSEDHCGNMSETTTLVQVNDVKPPTPYCLGIVVTATMTENGPVEIWASDFNLGGFDNVTGNTNCGNFGQLDVYFLDEFDQEVDFLEFDCDDIMDGVSQLITLEVYYEDEAGNRDFCIVQLLLQDNVNDACVNSAGSRIAGTIETEESSPLENVKVDVTSNSPDFIRTSYTDNRGKFAFELPINNNYYLNANMEDSPLNGVSTLDLVLIQRHILGIQTLDTPYKLIAADADDSNNISATDLITLRKLILGIYDEFPNGQKSWRFPEKGQDFIDSEKPFPYNETIDVLDLSTVPADGKDFVAVKIGDVNASAEVNFNNPTVEERNINSVTLEIDEMILTKGSLVSIPVYAKDMDNIVGLQSTINFDFDVLTFTGIEESALDVTEENLGLYAVNEGVITFSWNSYEEKNINADLPLFELQFTATDNRSLSEVIYFGSSLTNAEAYNRDLEILDVNLDFRGLSYDEFVLYQNIPNPFSQSTEIRFSLPSESEIIFSVYDVNGRELMRQKSVYSLGDHTITLHKDQLESSGVMYYTLESIFGVASRKMIQIK